MWFIAGPGWHFQLQDKEPWSCFLFFFFPPKASHPAFLFLHFPSEERAVCLSHKTRRIQPLGLEGVRGRYWEIGVVGCSLIKCTMTRIISHPCHWFLCVFSYYLLKNSHTLQRAFSRWYFIFCIYFILCETNPLFVPTCENTPYNTSLLCHRSSYCYNRMPLKQFPFIQS